MQRPRGARLKSLFSPLKLLCDGTGKAKYPAWQCDSWRRTNSRNEIDELFKLFKKKLDTDGDGRTDFTTKEAIEFVGEVVVVVAKRL